VPRSGRYGAGGKTWRHISQSGRVPPDRRLTDNVGSEDRGQPALYALFAHGTPLAGVIAV